MQICYQSRWLMTFVKVEQQRLRASPMLRSVIIVCAMMFECVSLFEQSLSDYVKVHQQEKMFLPCDSDIVRFTQLSGASTPYQVMNFCSALHHI